MKKKGRIQIRPRGTFWISLYALARTFTKSDGIAKHAANVIHNDYGNLAEGEPSTIELVTRLRDIIIIDEEEKQREFD